MTRPTDISIDLETLGQRSDAPVLSIGACAFNRDTGHTGPSYYAAVKLEDAMRHGRVKADTLTWWVTKNGSVFRDLLEQRGAVSLYEALRGLNDFVRAQPAGVCVWGNGSSFDISILEHAFDSVTAAGTPGFHEEWKFWSVRDMRTAVDLSGLNKDSIPFMGTAHNALDDAVHQAKVIAECFLKVKRLNKHGAAPAPAPTTQESEEW